MAGPSTWASGGRRRHHGLDSDVRALRRRRVVARDPEECLHYVEATLAFEAGADEEEGRRAPVAALDGIGNVKSRGTTSSFPWSAPHRTLTSRVHSEQT